MSKYIAIIELIFQRIKMEDRTSKSIEGKIKTKTGQLMKTSKKGKKEENVENIN